MSPLLGSLWREVARHREIEESVAALARLLRSAVPYSWLLVRRWDAERCRLETVAQSGLRVGAEPPAALPTPHRDALLGWAGRRACEAWIRREDSALARCLLPQGVSAPFSAVPLHVGDHFVGVLLLGTTALDARHVIEEACEPFAVALENDSRVHELARLREAAEQDRTALLTRLARQDVSDAIVGAERGLHEVMERVAQVARTDAPVLILGETGAGKEVVARAIHAQSRRERGPFLRVNCGAIPSELVDSELFGHEKGSFTGAIAQRKGWFERADGGTLFLDEVAELPAAAQVRLLRVLQDGGFQRVGGERTHTVDVRIVAATHRDMTRLIRDGAFRQDLWYRISVFPILLPALRDRREDIPAMAEHFATRAGVRLFGRTLSPTPADVALLTAYEWPGNVRELASVIERAAILGNGQTLRIAPALGVVPGSTSPAAPSRAPSDGREAIEAALRRCRGRIEGPFGAAVALGINPHTLRSRMRRFGIDWGRFRGVDL
jgi:transcriptional regulator with GAF, ATPase, and Fis domain